MRPGRERPGELSPGRRSFPDAGSFNAARARAPWRTETRLAELAAKQDASMRPGRERPGERAGELPVACFGSWLQCGQGASALENGRVSCRWLVLEAGFNAARA